MNKKHIPMSHSSLLFSTGNCNEVKAHEVDRDANGGNDWKRGKRLEGGAPAIIIGII